MNNSELIEYAEEVLYLVRAKKQRLSDYRHFGEFAEAVMYAAKQLTDKQVKAMPTLNQWAQGFRRLYDRFDQELSADPMLLYRPAHDVSLAFHSSNAFCRWYRAGNRTSKTQSGYAAHYFVVTNQHRWRFVPPGAHSTFIVGLEYTKYCPKVFEAKFLHGEEGNALSPMFPDGGKWFHSYDTKKHIITIACKNCAEKGKPKDCPGWHPKSSITLYSDKGGWESIQGAQFILGHFDEHIKDKKWFNETQQRLSSVRYRGKSVGKFVQTGTPLHGINSWEMETFTPILEGPPGDNVAEPGNPDSPPFVELFEIDQFKAGLVPPETILRNMKGYTDAEIECRVYGRPVPITETPVFDQQILNEWRRESVDPKFVVLEPTKEDDKVSGKVENIAHRDHIDAIELPDQLDNWTGLRVWKYPRPGGQYVIGVDTAKGLRHKDASAASVLELVDKGNRLELELVAQYHGWIGMLDYGTEVFKLCKWYNDALAVIERTGGYGENVILRLKDQLYYWNIFQDQSVMSVNAAMDTRYGVDTSQQSKPYMVSMLQHVIKEKNIILPCKQTIGELISFEQVDTSATGLKLAVPKFQGGGGALDDRVASLFIACFVAMKYNIYRHNMQ